MPFGNPLDRAHATALPDIPECNEAAARLLTQAAKRLRNGESVRDVFSGLIDPVIALSGRV
jgi:hypothetical protein